MAKNTVINMETGRYVRTQLPASGGGAKVRRFDHVPQEMRDKARALEIEKQALAKRRGAAKNCGPKERAAAKDIRDRIAAHKAEMVSAQAAAGKEHEAEAQQRRKAELAKQAAAAKRAARMEG